MPIIPVHQALALGIIDHAYYEYLQHVGVRHIGVPDSFLIDGDALPDDMTEAEFIQKVTVPYTSVPGRWCCN